MAIPLSIIERRGSVVASTSACRAAGVRFSDQACFIQIRCKNLALNIRDCLSVSFEADTKSRWSLLSGVYASGSKISHQSALEMCNLSSGLLVVDSHSNLEKDNSLNHSCVSAKMGCLEYT